MSNRTHSNLSRETAANNPDTTAHAHGPVPERPAADATEEALVRELNTSRSWTLPPGARPKMVAAFKRIMGAVTGSFPPVSNAQDPEDWSKANSEIATKADSPEGPAHEVLHNERDPEDGTQPGIGTQRRLGTSTMVFGSLGIAAIIAATWWATRSVTASDETPEPRQETSAATPASEPASAQKQEVPSGTQEARPAGSSPSDPQPSPASEPTQSDSPRFDPSRKVGASPTAPSTRGSAEKPATRDAPPASQAKPEFDPKTPYF